MSECKVQGISKLKKFHDKSIFIFITRKLEILLSKMRFIPSKIKLFFIVLNYEVGLYKSDV
jgi:hypothetical protein